MTNNPMPEPSLSDYDRRSQLAILDLVESAIRSIEGAFRNGVGSHQITGIEAAELIETWRTTVRASIDAATNGHGQN